MIQKVPLTELNNIFVTADQHLGHENIIKFCDRPFVTIEEMDQVLIDNWNKVVGKDDIIYHLADFTLGDFTIARRYFAQLNGKIQVLANHWHHDKRWLPKNYFGPLFLEYPDCPDIGHVNILPPMVVLEIEEMGDEGRALAVTLCHYPLACWDRKHYGAWHLYGHTHKPDDSDEFRLNIGVDCMNYHPISLGNVLTLMYKKGW
jgi:calcineurin-like phosphoesterase family protein